MSAKRERVTKYQRDTVRDLLAQGLPSRVIAARLELTISQVAAIAAHVGMGTYGTPSIAAASSGERSRESAPSPSSDLSPLQPGRTSTGQPDGTAHATMAAPPVYLGAEELTGDPIFWNPDPDTGAANPHMLVIGESGFGKTYSISSILTELGRQGLPSLVFDYGQGFSRVAAPAEFVEWARPVELSVDRDGVDVNPFKIFPSDQLGPVNVAQRVADTFARVYSKLGVQQHAVLRQAVLDVMGEHGIRAESADSWGEPPPAFASLQRKLVCHADQFGGQGKIAAALASHISTVFFYNTFRAGGQRLAWDELLGGGHSVVVLQLSGLEHTLERAVTEFLLWNFIGYVESRGPSRLRCFVVLDEAHRLSFDPGSPVEKLLREGRKFGVGLILASQQPEDFSPVAFANTATKLVFQVADERCAVSRQLGRKLHNRAALGDVSGIITKLPRGVAFLVSENLGRVVRIANFGERSLRWRR